LSDDPRADAADRIDRAQAELARLSPRKRADGSWSQARLKCHTDGVLAQQSGLDDEAPDDDL
jgi:hypothetical protein